MATQPSVVWDGHNYPQPAMMHSAFFSQTIMPMVQPNSFLPSETLPQNNMALPTPCLRSAFDPCLPHFPDTDILVSRPPPKDHFSQQLPGPSLGHLPSSPEESSEWSVGSQESFSSPPSTPPDLSPPSFWDNLDPWDSNAIGYQYVILPERDVGWGQLFCGSGEELGANVTSSSEVSNPCPVAAAAPAVGSDSRQAFRCSCCRKHQPAMRFSRDGSIPTEQTRHKEPKGDQSSDGSQAEKPCIICRAQRPVEGFPSVGARPSRRCSRCIEEGRQPEERPLKRPRSGSKESTPSSSRASPTQASQPGHAYCSGCSKTQAVDRFADPRREGRLLRTCLQCRTRKNTADRKKREKRLEKN
ncbi:unnamed protein product [Clonostachys rhizophaga]|uniref:Uncharacterized protein n=1 Tax=Clonostachys rhizophaga TaxID=160324 RepID=A0A9N9V709_9HYPO|nr:unnamed protein product [Clonostachys rhizophaga]